MNITRVSTFLSLFLCAFPLLAQDSTLFHFKLEDQFSETHRYEQYIGKVLIVVGSDREGSRYNEIWRFAIHDSLKKVQLEDSVTFIAVANVKGVPRLFRGFVRGKFPRQQHHRILMDWDGDFARIYQYQPAETNILLIDREGHVVHQLNGTDLDPESISRLLEKVAALF